MSFNKKFLNYVVALSEAGSAAGHGGPFGAIVVKNGEIIGEGFNCVTSLNDPTAHAEVVAIRDACSRLKAFQLDGCEIYTSCEPCPMCLGAIYWARPERVYFANTRDQAADAGFDDAFIYDEIAVDPETRSIPMIHCPDNDAEIVFEKWKLNPDKTLY